jgi:hypothetical protein
MPQKSFSFQGFAGLQIVARSFGSVGPVIAVSVIAVPGVVFVQGGNNAEKRTNDTNKVLKGGLTTETGSVNIASVLRVSA